VVCGWCPPRGDGVRWVGEQGITLHPPLADEIVTDRLRPKVEKVLECLPDAARLISPDMDDASAFRAAGEMQNAYRKLSRRPSWSTG